MENKREWRMTVRPRLHIGRNLTTIRFSDEVNGPRGLDWRMFGWCGGQYPPAAAAHHKTMPPPSRDGVYPCKADEVPSNITISDLHLHGATNYTSYAQIAGPREHGSLIFFYQFDPALPPIVNLTVERVLVCRGPKPQSLKNFFLSSKVCILSF
jgi:hypothetical protein